MKMKARNKILLLALCMVALIAVSVLGTMAYLTSTDEVINTFTVGKVAITLDEAKVDTDGKALTGDQAQRVKENTYKLIPGHDYDKDPTIHVTGGSENSWLFIKVENGIAAFEADGDNTIAKQIAANGWSVLNSDTGIYYKEYSSQETVLDVSIFKTIKLADNAETKTGWGTKTHVTVTAYAVQKDGFTTANVAWDATFGKPSADTNANG